MSLQFELPAGISAEKFIEKLNKKADIQLISRRYCLRTYYDSFDWRLWSNGILCEFNRSKAASILTLRTVKNGRLISGCELSEIPPFPTQLKPGPIQDTLHALLQMRALLAVCTLEYEEFQLNVLNEDDKILLRLSVDEFELCNGRIMLQPIKGYEHAANNMAELLTDDMGLTPADKPVLLAALQLQGRKPKEYSSKLKITLAPDTRADSAVKIIFLHLLKTIKDNEQGTIAEIDSEFLHDFRVALRRSRSGLTQLKGVLPEDKCDYFSDFFSWLGQVTCPARDLDVYLASFDEYKKRLPEDIRDELNPFYDFLFDKKQKARRNLALKLRSAKYKTALLEWEEYLKQPQPMPPSAPNAHLTIKELANRSIWKLYKRAVSQGNDITPRSPADHLHRLRKTCKKLRYLLEFFQSFYPEQEIKPLLKDLKRLQDVLGDFQDCSVQEHAIRLFSDEMIRNKTPAKTFLAMGMLIQSLDAKKCLVRKQFSSRLERFKRKRNHSAFKSLFGTR